MVKVAMSGYKRKVPEGKAKKVQRLRAEEESGSGGIRRNTGLSERSKGLESGGS